MTGYILIAVVMMLLGSLVSGRLQSKFKKYSKIPLAGGLSGKEIAEKMLRERKGYIFSAFRKALEYKTEGGK